MNDILRRPKLAEAYGLTAAEITGIVQLLHSHALVVSGRVTIPRTARDPRDDHVLACAVEGGADYIVSGDRDLLNLEAFRGIPIISPAAFAALLEAAG